jgi:hypothetical protein
MAGLLGRALAAAGAGFTGTMAKGMERDYLSQLESREAEAKAARDEVYAIKAEGRAATRQDAVKVQDRAYEKTQRVRGILGGREVTEEEFSALPPEEQAKVVGKGEYISAKDQDALGRQNLALDAQIAASKASRSESSARTGLMQSEYRDKKAALDSLAKNTQAYQDALEANDEKAAKKFAALVAQDQIRLGTMPKMGEGKFAAKTEYSKYVNLMEKEGQAPKPFKDWAAMFSADKGEEIVFPGAKVEEAAEKPKVPFKSSKGRKDLEAYVEQLRLMGKTEEEIAALLDKKLGKRQSDNPYQISPGL